MSQISYLNYVWLTCMFVNARIPVLQSASFIFVLRLIEIIFNSDLPFFQDTLWILIYSSILSLVSCLVSVKSV
ncbi:hypothetical protein IW262DRAFT_1418983, partial [Armillaria fumosa]